MEVPQVSAEEPNVYQRAIQWALSAWRFLSPKLPDLADSAMLYVVLVSTALALWEGAFVLTAHVLAASLIGFALCYLITSLCLRSRQELGLQRLFISLCSMISAIWLFEIVYHYYGWNQWGRWLDGFFTLALNTTSSPFPLLWALILTSLVFTGARYMGANRWFLVTLLGGIAIMELWLAAGFPSYFNPEWWPARQPYLPLVPLEYTHAPNAAAAQAIAFWGGFFNSAAKIIWCLLPASLFITKQNLKGGLSAALRHPLPTLRRLLFPWTAWGGNGQMPGGAPPAPALEAGETRS